MVNIQAPVKFRSRSNHGRAEDIAQNTDRNDEGRKEGVGGVELGHYLSYTWSEHDEARVLNGREDIGDRQNECVNWRAICIILMMVEKVMIFAHFLPADQFRGFFGSSGASQSRKLRSLNSLPASACPQLWTDYSSIPLRRMSR